MKNLWKELLLKSTLQEPIKDLARLEWHKACNLTHYDLSVDTMTRPMQVLEDEAPHRKSGKDQQ